MNVLADSICFSPLVVRVLVTEKNGFLHGPVTDFFVLVALDYRVNTGITGIRCHASSCFGGLIPLRSAHS